MLCRCALATAISLGVIAGVQRYSAAPRVEAAVTLVTVDPRTTPEPQWQQWQELEDQSHRRDQFVHFSDDILARLGRREMHVAEAAERLLYFCLDRYPEHLENVMHVEAGATLQAKLASNLVRDLRGRLESGDADSCTALIAWLGAELNALNGAGCSMAQ